MTCEICTKTAAVTIGGTPLCRTHAADIHIEIDRLRAEGRAVNVPVIARRLWRAQTKLAGGPYPLRDIPADLWQEAKQRALTDGVSLRELILTALMRYIRG